jgi:uncharacterized protein YkwD
VDQLNEVRRRLNLPAVPADPQVMEAAKIQADWEAQTDTLTHDGPPNLETMAKRLQHCEVNFSAAGEITAGAPFTQAIDLWLNSPGHRVILTDPSWRACGAAVATSARGTAYSTADFVR